MAQVPVPAVVEAEGAEDLYRAFLAAVGAPTNHGHNLDALADSISGRQMNSIELPYKIVIDGFSRMSDEAKEMTKRFRDLVIDLKIDRHDPIDIEVPGLYPAKTPLPVSASPLRTML